MYIADIIIDISHEKLDRIFQYSIPDDLKENVSVGSVVEVPFGVANRIITGYVTAVYPDSSELKIDSSCVKEIVKVRSGDELPEGRMIALAAWMKEYYGSTMSQALKTVLPVKDKVKEKEHITVTLSTDSNMVSGYLERMKKKNAKARVRLLKALMECGSGDFNEIKTKLKVTPKTLKDLEEAGVVKVERNYSYRRPFDFEEVKSEKIVLNDDQKKVCDTVINDLRAGIRKNYLLHGVTGSGKTICYIEIIKEVVARGRQVIVLIPEIALTYQTIKRFRGEFNDRVSVLHSKMSKGEKYDQFLRAVRKDIDIIIGPRSALFTPFNNIGLIVIDEEHDESYKNDPAPRYDAGKTALHIAKEHNASVLLASATPSTGSYYKALNKEYKLLELKNKALAKEAPKVFVEDMRKELKEGNREIFSRNLMTAIDDRLKKKEQIMLFLNKRGFAGFISCRSCGHVIKCPHCDISMTYHKNGRLMCHFCGHEETMLKICPKCGSKHIAGFRAGTQQIEERIKKLFPGAGVLRMDKDTTTGKSSHLEILSKFADHEADILIGTQMIVKGHDFSNVTLVAAIAADMSLFYGDYRAGERTFQLLEQMAGRAGRADKPGEVYIQTYAPDNFCIQCVKNHDYNGFYEEEIRHRKLMLYPPVWSMLTVSFSSLDEELLKKAVESIITDKDFKEWETKHTGKCMVIGPAREVIYRIEDRYRMVMYVKGEDDNVLSGLKSIIDRRIKEDNTFDKVLTVFDRA